MLVVERMTTVSRALAVQLAAAAGAAATNEAPTRAAAPTEAPSIRLARMSVLPCSLGTGMPPVTVQNSLGARAAPFITIRFQPRRSLD
ncbi:hypothetical protein GCM10010269_01220 [Streptomyces humidus]|uniref:Uncharacterized protein n=1 Tax=Streptomyces humidus TaxID=52259 RepID=A0A918FPX3_9ACTN|nr:hypothetical protein GCM10010269_01220 [Streptomyces humidus]